MTIQNWSEDIIMVDLADEPAFTEDVSQLTQLQQGNPRHAVLSFGAVDFLNSSNISRLLKLRKAVQAGGRRLILCGLNTQVWGIFLVTGLDKIFECTDDTATALATLQMGGQINPKGR